VVLSNEADWLLLASFPRARDRDNSREVTGITPPLADAAAGRCLLACVALL
jgi:hypothetical protein